MSPRATPGRSPDPVLAEWGYYSADCARLAALPLGGPCGCRPDCGTDAQCCACEDMVRAFRQELDKSASFIHVRGLQSGHCIAACELQTQAAIELADGERMVRLGQAEDAAAAAMSMAQALARFRRSSFTGLWRQLDRLRAHCSAHFAVLADAIAASPLYGESSHDPYQLLRVSHVYAAIHAHYEADPVRPPPPPALALWRGWVDPFRLRRVLDLLQAHLPGTTHAGGLPSPPDTFGLPSADLPRAHPVLSARRPHGRTVCTVFLDSAELTRYHAGLAAGPSGCDMLSLWWATDDDEAAVHVSHDVASGPWLADRRCAAAAALPPHQLLPFLHSELNLNKLAPVGSPRDLSLSPSPDSDAEHRSHCRDLQRSVQKIQRKIIMERLRPLILASEERFDFMDAS
ncbi:hypothetical protein LPJ61_005789, partial [Coemansia biformis]